MNRSTRTAASLPETEPRAAAAPLLAVAALALIALALSGCAASQSSGSISDSSGSFSDSSGSISDSSTSSSGDDTAYRRDVETYTVAHVRAGGSPEALRPGLSEVALARGISDWEAYRATFVAIGLGLAEAGAGDEELAAYRQALTEPGSENDEAIVEGFGEASR
jgi:hypothetical protein